MVPKRRPGHGRIYPFNYFVPRKEDRELKIHQRRDLCAAIELLPVLMQLGWAYGEPILNMSPSNLAELLDEDLDEADLAVPILKMDLEFLKAGDLLLQTTRPPLDDWGERTRKKVQRGYTELERILLDLWRTYFATCARSHVRLEPFLAKALKAGFKNRRDMYFLERTTAPYSSVGIGKRESPKNRTAAFLLRVEEVWKGGPGLVGAFAMDGTSTQVWTYRLARDFKSLLSRPGFVVAEMECAPPPDRPLDLKWANDWKIDVILDHRL